MLPGERVERLITYPFKLASKATGLAEFIHTKNGLKNSYGTEGSYVVGFFAGVWSFTLPMSSEIYFHDDPDGNSLYGLAVLTDIASVAAPVVYSAVSGDHAALWEGKLAYNVAAHAMVDAVRTFRLKI